MPLSNPPHPTALTIAGSDPSGGAGLQADLKTFEQLGVYGMSVVTLLTVQNTQGVQRVEPVATDLVSEQLDAVLNDIPPRAIKTGALGNTSIISAVASALRVHETTIPLIVDPVLVSKHGHRLAGDDVVQAYREQLIPLATLITPNRFEAERLTGQSLDGERTESDWTAVAQQLLRLGARSVLLKAGPVGGKRLHVFANREGNAFIESADQRSRNNHGAGCTLSAILAGLFAVSQSEKDSDALRYARQAVEAVSQGIRHAPNLGSQDGDVAEPSKPGQGPLQTQVIRTLRHEDKG
ncbi:MAG: bifunctional hydroxymethylpyrimidine kinase/phosphomethylpyrimidine kinase [Planctomycetota bacterium]